MAGFKIRDFQGALPKQDPAKLPENAAQTADGVKPGDADESGDTTGPAGEASPDFGDDTPRTAIADAGAEHSTTADVPHEPSQERLSPGDDHADLYASAQHDWQAPLAQEKAADHAVASDSAANEFVADGAANDVTMTDVAGAGGADTDGAEPADASADRATADGSATADSDEDGAETDKSAAGDFAADGSETSGMHDDDTTRPTPAGNSNDSTR